MHALGLKIFHTKLKINSMSIRNGNVEYIVALQRKIARIDLKTAIFTGRSPLVFTLLTHSMIRDVINVLQI